MARPQFRVRGLMIAVGAVAVFFAVAERAPLSAIIFLPPLYLLIYLVYRHLTKRRLANPSEPE